jgi:hypothetical protein
VADEMNRTVDCRGKFSDVSINVRREVLDRFPETLIIEIERRKVRRFEGSFDFLEGS